MKTHKTISFGLLLITLLFTLPSVADDPGKNKLIGEIYLGHGQILDAAPPRQLSFRANVSQFAYQPGGDAIAFTGAQVNGDSISYFASLAGTQHGTITKLATDTVNLRQEEQRLGISEDEISKMEASLGRSLTGSDFLRNQTQLTLSGWSADGKYLLISQTQFASQTSTDENTPPQEVSATTYTCVDMTTSPPTQRQIALPLTLQTNGGGISSQSWWSPKKTLILFEQTALQQDAKLDTMQKVCTLYDPATQHLTSFALPAKSSLFGWLDDTHLLFIQLGDKGRNFLSRDITTGQDTEIPRPTQFFKGLADSLAPKKVSPINPALMLEEQPMTFPDSQKVALMSSQALWIRRTTGLKPLSALPISLALDPGPYEEWSPSGRQVAYLMHGDLFVTDLIVRDASAREKLALGLALNCNEQKQVGMENLKQIGLAIIMYSQDYDEIYPPASDVNNRIMPYIKDQDVFSVGNSKFVYHGTGQSLASINAPADYVLGTMDTPCAHIVVYADGHVKSFDKQDNGPSGANDGPCTEFTLPKIKSGELTASLLAAHGRVSGMSAMRWPGM